LSAWNVQVCGVGAKLIRMALPRHHLPEYSRLAAIGPFEPPKYLSMLYGWGFQWVHLSMVRAPSYLSALLPYFWESGISWHQWTSSYHPLQHQSSTKTPFRKLLPAIFYPQDENTFNQSTYEIGLHSPTLRTVKQMTRMKHAHHDRNEKQEQMFPSTSIYIGVKSCGERTVEVSDIFSVIKLWHTLWGSSLWAYSFFAGADLSFKVML